MRGMPSSLKVEGELGKNPSHGSSLQAHSQADLIRKKYTWKSGIWKLILRKKANLTYPSWKAASPRAKSTEAHKGHWQTLRRQLPSQRLKEKENRTSETDLEEDPIRPGCGPLKRGRGCCSKGEIGCQRVLISAP